MVTVQSVSTVASGTAATLELNPPSGVTAGDLLIAFIVTDSITPDGAISGWTEVQESNTTNDSGGGGSLTTLQRVATGTDDYTVTFGGGTVARGVVVRIDGQRTTAPVSTSSEQVNDTTSTTATGATVTPSNTDSLLIIAVGSFQTTGNQTHSTYAVATSDPGGWTEGADNSDAGDGEALAVAYDNRTEVTATGDATATISASCKSIVHVIAVAGNISVTMPVGALTVTHPALVTSTTQSIPMPVGQLTVSHPALTTTSTDRNISNKSKTDTSPTITNKSKNSV